MKIQNVNLSDIDSSKASNEIPTEFHSDFTSHNNLTVTPKPGEKLPSTKVPFKTRLKAKLTRKNIIILSIAAGILVIGGALFYIFNYIVKVKPSPSSILIINSSYIEATKTDQTNTLRSEIILPLPSEPRTEASPMNGVLFTASEMTALKKRRPIFVTIDNHSAARPQANFTKADLVFETLAESGISRYMAAYWNNSVNEIGPIRSLRQYFLEWLSPYDPILVHDGCATSSDARTNACGNVISYKIKQLNYGTYGAYRDTSRYAPHNEFVHPSTVWSRAEDVGWGQFPSGLETLKYKADAKPADRGTQTKVKVILNKYMRNGGLYDSVWTYDKARNLYLREVGGKKDVDKVTKAQLNAKVVVLLEVKFANTFNSKGHVIITTIGEGKAKILQDGKIFNLTWKKPSRTDIIKYYNADGTEFTFNRGLMWIAAVPGNDGQIDILAQ